MPPWDLLPGWAASMKKALIVVLVVLVVLTGLPFLLGVAGACGDCDPATLNRSAACAAALTALAVLLAGAALILTARAEAQERTGLASPRPPHRPPRLVRALS